MNTVSPFITEIPENINNEDLQNDPINKKKFINVALIARKNSGKSVLLLNMIKKRVRPNDHVIIISPSVETDPVYKNLIDYMTSNNITYVLNDGSQMDETITNIETEQISLFNEKFYTSQKNNILIIDDMANGMRKSVILTDFLKKNRHKFTQTYLCAQYVSDFNPQQYLQFDMLILFNGLSEVNLKFIYDRANITLNISKFIDLYRTATHEKYSFITVDTRDGAITQNFNNIIHD